MSSKNEHITIDYWAIRGLAQPIRLLLEYTKIPYEDKRYTAEEAPWYSRKDWTDVKEHLDLDFPNLPYLIDGDLRISQSGAIIRHIARKAKILPKEEHDLAIMEMIEAEIVDMRSDWTGLCYTGKDTFESEKSTLERNLPARLNRFEAWLAKKGNQWLIGNQLTYPDFMFYEVLDSHRIMWPNIFHEYSNLKSYMERFEKIPEVNAYLQSTRCIKRPINNPSSSFR